jgi:hypothetical protein
LNTKDIQTTICESLEGQNDLVSVFGVVPGKKSGVFASTCSHVRITAVGQENCAETTVTIPT